MSTLHESAHGRAGDAASAIPARRAEAGRSVTRKRGGLVRRLRAFARLVRRAVRARHEYAELRQLDAVTLRDLGLSASELGSVDAELRGRAASSRRRTDLESQLSSSRFRVREIDSVL
jgi:uncharacterized protein YjiS (DUF1127 family)